MDNTEKTKKLVDAMRKMNHVYRCSGTRLLRPYSLAEHGFHVANLFITIAKVEDVIISSDMAYLAMNHDIVETLTGDLLYPAKNTDAVTKAAWEVIEYRVTQGTGLELFTDSGIVSAFEGFPDAYALYKDCDMLELLLTLREELVCGNTHPSVMQIVNVAEGVLNNSKFQTVRALAGLMAELCVYGS